MDRETDGLIAEEGITHPVIHFSRNTAYKHFSSPLIHYNTVLTLVEN